MNIFYLHHNPEECAKLHNDKHVVKMILEYAQLLSTAHRILDGHEIVELTANGRKIKRWKLEDTTLDTTIYKSTHANHPSAVWVRQSRQNYYWLFALWKALMEEYTYRYGKTHSASRLYDALYHSPKNISDAPFTEPTPAMPDEYKVPGNSIQAYINYYLGAKQHLANWKKRSIPSWYVIN